MGKGRSEEMTPYTHKHSLPAVLQIEMDVRALDEHGLRWSLAEPKTLLNRPKE